MAKHPHTHRSRFITALYTRNFRLYFLGQCISLTGNWVQNIAMSWFVYRLTDSILLLTTVTFLNQIPSLFLAPFAGVLSDRLNRYRILLTTQSLYMVQAGILSLLAITGKIEVWHILALSFFAGLLAAFESPARQSFFTKLVRRTEIGNAIALNSIALNASRFIGPSIGGLLISWIGEGYCFMVNSFSYMAVLIALVCMRLPRFQQIKSKLNFGLEFKTGLQYVCKFLPIRAIMLVVGAFSLFGLPVASILPAYVRDVLQGDSTLLGYLMSSVGAGALTAGIALAGRRKINGMGGFVALSGIWFALGLCLLSRIDVPFWACVVCFPVGFGMISLIAGSNTLLQTIVQDDKRGRVMSFFTMACAGMSPLGSIGLGFLAQQIGIDSAIFLAGCICLLVILIFYTALPSIRKTVPPEESGTVGE